MVVPDDRKIRRFVGQFLLPQCDLLKMNRYGKLYNDSRRALAVFVTLDMKAANTVQSHVKEVSARRDCASK